LSNVNITDAKSEPLDTKDELPVPLMQKLIALRINDFPDPVSPVIAESPFDISKLISEIIIKFLIYIDLSTGNNPYKKEC
jgi:hypothetical protein